MILVAVMIGLILIGIGAFIYGAIGISKYAFRVGTGPGVAALLFPPYTLYFAFVELGEEDKNLPVASWVFGIVVTALLGVLFAQPLSYALTGQFDRLQGPENVGEAATQAYGDQGASEDNESSSDEASDESNTGDDERASDQGASSASGESDDASQSESSSDDT